MRFRDRRQAGAELALRLRYLRGHHTVVLGSSGGGLLVAKEIADVLHAPLDVLLTHRIEFGPPTTTLGAVGEGDVLVSDHDALRRFSLTPEQFSQLAGQARAELARQIAGYRRPLPPVPITGQTVVLADDGVATGATAHAAIRVLRARGVREVVLAVPVGPARTLDRLAREVDQLLCLRPLPWMHAVRNSYTDFTGVADTDAIALLGGEPAPPVAAR
ncbi:phosphoribosyltransferase family protein [Amycolatopsis carbonis]|uniref:Phosphoribosyltransferase family protein n=1 Tax=Amycolatopsis carbonis TaxID=715471 RepID=A0A9Y2MNS1_9PSEU|nr:phosphoribosyltransferase family protein [Amycolatopsis sp. 2-15]WIX75145.1 phosphoribosyltransferase family protein [Amycolatopsis sp. 2-15]